MPFLSYCEMIKYIYTGILVFKAVGIYHLIIYVLLKLGNIKAHGLLKDIIFSALD